MATLSDIAKKCSTSTATVSYVLSGQGDRRRISPEMQEKIQQAAKELGYRQRNPAEKSRPPKICLFWPDKNLETAIANVVTGVNTALLFESSPVELSIIPFGYTPLISQNALWSSKIYDAAVILSPNKADMEALTQRRTKIPTVLINRSIDGYSSVTTDYEEVGRLAAEQAIAKAGDDIALIHNSVPHVGMTLRSQAIYKVCKSYGVHIDENIFYCSNSIDEAYELGIRFLRQKKLPRAIICVYDTVAFGLIRAFNEAGVAVGKDVEVLTTGTSTPQFFARSTPSISVVDLKLTELSQRAVRLAIDLATQRVTAPTNVVIQPELIYRESSPPPSLEQRQKLIERKRKFMAAR